jgi:hypothetical protein
MAGEFLHIDLFDIKQVLDLASHQILQHDKAFESDKSLILKHFEISSRCNRELVEQQQEHGFGEVRPLESRLLSEFHVDTCNEYGKSPQLVEKSICVSRPLSPLKWVSRLVHRLWLALGLPEEPPYEWSVVDLVKWGRLMEKPLYELDMILDTREAPAFLYLLSVKQYFTRYSHPCEAYEKLVELCRDEGRFFWSSQRSQWSLPPPLHHSRSLSPSSPSYSPSSNHRRNASSRQAPSTGPFRQEIPRFSPEFPSHTPSHPEYKPARASPSLGRRRSTEPATGVPSQLRPLQVRPGPDPINAKIQTVSLQFGAKEAQGSKMEREIQSRTLISVKSPPNNPHQSQSMNHSRIQQARADERERESLASRKQMVLNNEQFLSGNCFPSFRSSDASTSPKTSMAIIEAPAKERQGQGQNGSLVRRDEEGDRIATNSSHTKRVVFDTHSSFPLPDADYPLPTPSPPRFSG